MELLRKLNWIDVLVIILIIRISYVAFQEGLSHEIFPIIGALSVIIIALHYYNKIGIFFSQNLLNMPLEISNFLSFLILAIGISYIVKWLKAFLDKMIKIQWHPFIERFGGLAIGLVRASIVASIVLITIALMPLPYLQWSIRDRSLTGMYFLKIGPNIYEKSDKFLASIRAKEPSVNKDELIKNLASDKSLIAKEHKR